MNNNFEFFINKIENIMTKGFSSCGYDAKYARVKLSDRPDLCQYQCNGALSAAKEYHKAPFMIADDVVNIVKDNDLFKSIEVVKPGFINIIVSDEALADYLNAMDEDENLGFIKVSNPDTIVIDYGGANVAKPLHVGHLRSAVRGESIKRLARYVGHNVVGDVHLGDWGLQIGLIITELSKRQPELVYFDDSYEGDYPKEPPFTMSDLEEIYPYANALSKEDDAYKALAQEATAQLQKGRRGYIALWQHIINVSVSDLKVIYTRLNVDFDLWKKESDAQEYIPDMVSYMKDEGYAHIDQGALVVDVAEETDTQTIPPCMILKSNGATLYNTTDLATIVERRKLFNPNRILYVVDKRQSLYFEQVFRCAKKTKIIGDDVELKFIGFGTMNGVDGKPFKTRDGGVLRLEHLIDETYESVLEKMADRDMDEDTLKETANKVALAAIKYGDLSNLAPKDYIFDIKRFTSFEGNTGPYILYTAVRIKSLLQKAKDMNIDINDVKIKAVDNEFQTDVSLTAVKWNQIITDAFAEYEPQRICQFLFELAEKFNRFYHENKILTNEDEELRASWMVLSKLVLKLLCEGLDLLGLEVPEKM